MYEVQSPWEILVVLFRGSAWLLDRINARKETCSSAFPLVVQVPQRASIALVNTRVGCDPRRQSLPTVFRAMQYGGMDLIAYKHDVAQDPVYFNYLQQLVSLRFRTCGNLDGVEGARSRLALPDRKFSDEGHVVSLYSVRFGLGCARLKLKEALDFREAQ